MSLSGKTIVITRDINQSSGFANLLESHGANAVRFPVIKIMGPGNPEQIRITIAAIDSVDWIIFTSTNAVKFFMELSGQHHSLLDEAKIACVGQKTAEKLAGYERTPDLVPESFTSRDILKSMQNHQVKNSHILLPVSRLANHLLEKELTKRGAHVHRIEIYNTMPFHNPDKELLSIKINNNEIDCITFFSPSAVNSFADQMGVDIIDKINSCKITIAAIGPTTARAVKDRHMIPAIVPVRSDEEILLQEMLEYWSSGVLE